EDHGDPAAADAIERATPETQQLRVAEPDGSTGAGVPRQQPEHRHRGEGLSRTGFAGQAVDAPGVQLQREPLHEGTADLDGEVVDVEDAHAPPPLDAARSLCFSCVTSAVGSSTSRIASPRKLNASTTVRIARPGKTPSHQASKFCM